MAKTVILGFGNPCRSDDAIGVFVVNELTTIFKNREDITVLDMGTGAFEVLFKIKGHQKIILVDAVINSGEPAGTMFKLPTSDILRAPVEDPMVFLHSIKWDQALSYAKKMLQDEYPEDIEVYLIAIDDTRLAMEMSEPVKSAGNRLINIIAERFGEEKRVLPIFEHQ